MTQFVYLDSPAHYLEEVINAQGRTGARCEYDDDGRVVKVFDVHGNPLEMVHELGSRSKRLIDALGNPTRYAYDEWGNVVTQIDALGGITRYTYDESYNQLSTTDPLGDVTSFTLRCQW